MKNEIRRRKRKKTEEKKKKKKKKKEKKKIVIKVIYFILLTESKWNVCAALSNRSQGIVLVTVSAVGSLQAAGLVPIPVLSAVRLPQSPEAGVEGQGRPCVRCCLYQLKVGGPVSPVVAVAALLFTRIHWLNFVHSHTC